MKERMLAFVSPLEIAFFHHFYLNPESLGALEPRIYLYFAPTIPLGRKTKTRIMIIALMAS